MITCDEIRDAQKTKKITADFNEKKMQYVKQKISMVYLPFYQLV